MAEPTAADFVAYHKALRVWEEESQYTMPWLPQPPRPVPPLSREALGRHILTRVRVKCDELRAAVLAAIEAGDGHEARVQTLRLLGEARYAAWLEAKLAGRPYLAGPLSHQEHYNFTDPYPRAQRETFS